MDRDGGRRALRYQCLYGPTHIRHIYKHTKNCLLNLVFPRNKRKIISMKVLFLQRGTNVTLTISSLYPPTHTSVGALFTLYHCSQLNSSPPPKMTKKPRMVKKMTAFPVITRPQAPHRICKRSRLGCNTQRRDRRGSVPTVVPSDG